MYDENTSGWKNRLYKIIFESDTPQGRTFDIFLIFLISLSVIIVMLDSMEEYRSLYGHWFYLAEWVFTLLFTTEYLLRLISVSKKKEYFFSFYGIIDLLAILPTYISLLFPGVQLLIVIRFLRLLRLFRVLKMVRYIEGSSVIIRALRVSRPKIIVFLFTIFSIAMISGAVMYIIEGPENGYRSIPESMYWAIVTISTVGYGDISPQTGLGKMIASIMMISSYGILAVPTGIVTYELAQAGRVTRTKGQRGPFCPYCREEQNDPDANYCKHCGGKL